MNKIRAIFTNRVVKSGKIDPTGNEVATPSMTVFRCEDGNFDNYEQLIEKNPHDFQSVQIFKDIYKEMREHGGRCGIFIHGFNNTHPKAIEKTKELFENFPHDHQICISWSSVGHLFGTYHNDADDAATTGHSLGKIFKRLTATLTELNANCHGQINLFAHSMGGQVVEAMLLKIQQDKSHAKVFRNIFLLHADIDNDAFRHSHMKRINEIAVRAWAVINEDDNVTEHISKPGKNYGKGRLANGSVVDYPRNVKEIDLTKFKDSDSLKDRWLDHWTVFNSPKSIKEINEILDR